MTPGPPRMSLPMRAAWRARKMLVARPRPAGEIVGGPLVVAGFFRTASGVGESARTCAAALELAGLTPERVDVSGAFGQEDLSPFARLTPMPNARAGTLILHVNAPETERALFHLKLWRPKSWRVIGFWAYELPDAPPSWRTAQGLVTEVWAPSRFVADAVEKVVDVPVRVATHYVAPAASRPPRQHIGGACLAMADGRSSFDRKNILGAVDAFRRASGERDDVSLTVKTRNLGEYPEFADRLRRAVDGDRRIRMIDRALDNQGVEALYAEADVFLSLHRAEGFGLTIAEAMARGLAVVATDWSGSREFFDGECGIAVRAAMTPVSDSAGLYVRQGAFWADPNIDEAAAGLKRLFDEPALRARLAAAAQARIATKLGPSSYLAALNFPQQSSVG